MMMMINMMMMMMMNMMMNMMINMMMMMNMMINMISMIMVIVYMYIPVSLGEGVRDVDVEKSVGLSDSFVCFIGYDDGIFEFKLYRGYTSMILLTESCIICVITNMSIFCTITIIWVITDVIIDSITSIIEKYSFPFEISSLQVWLSFSQNPSGSNHLLRWWLGCIITSSGRYLGSITILRRWLDP